MALPVRRCSSTRTESRTSWAPAKASWSSSRRMRRAASAQRREWTSRRPPRPSLRSGSSRKATSPALAWRASTPSPRAVSQRWLAPPGGRRPLVEVVGDSRVARDQAGVEQRRGGVEIVVGEGQRLLHRADAVAELQARVPERVPDPLGQLLDLARSRSLRVWMRRTSRSLPGHSSPRP